jgi:hypothetical protein
MPLSGPSRRPAGPAELGGKRSFAHARGNNEVAPFPDLPALTGNGGVRPQALPSMKRFAPKAVFGNGPPPNWSSPPKRERSPGDLQLRREYGFRGRQSPNPRFYWMLSELVKMPSLMGGKAPSLRLRRCPWRVLLTLLDARSLYRETLLP